MADRLKKEEFVHRLAAHMEVDDAVAGAWVDGIIETLYESFKAGEGVTLPGFGSFYVSPESQRWIFRFNPATITRHISLTSRSISKWG